MDEPNGTSPPPHDFRRELVAILPHLRAFARSMCGRADLADDLVQETAMKAWAARDRFIPGTSLRAWAFTILRNVFLSQLRRNRRRIDYDQVDAERLLVVEPDQDDRLHLADVEAGLQRMSPERREALLLVGAGGFTYEEAAQICDCPIGTMKSRVARARTELSGYLGTDADKAIDLAD